MMGKLAELQAMINSAREQHCTPVRFEVSRPYYDELLAEVKTLLIGDSPQSAVTNFLGVPFAILEYRRDMHIALYYQEP